MTKALNLCCRKKSNGSDAGFSLIELAIVMVIIGLLTVPLMQRYRVYHEQEQLDYTTIAMNALNTALGDFYIQNGYYPLPSNRSVAFGQPLHGKSVLLATLTGMSNNSCSGGNGVCKTTGVPGVVYTGGFPYTELNVPYTDAIDGYKRYISYSVSAEMTDPARANDETRVGAISVDVQKTSGGVTSTTTDSNVFYALVSYGDNGNGAFNLDGRQLPCVNGLNETENCDIDANFFDTRDKSYARTNRYYDDYIQYVSATPSSIWALSIDSPGAIYNTNSGPIGIGTKTPDSSNIAIKVDVVGDVKADNFRGQQYCDRNGINCMLAEAIGGTGIIQCPLGQYLTGVAGNNEQCEPMAINVVPRTCGANQYVSAINSGGIITCSNLP